MKLVRNNYYGFSVLFHFAEDRKKTLGLLRSKHRSRLVKNENVRTSVKDLDYLNRLLFRD